MSDRKCASCNLPVYDSDEICKACVSKTRRHLANQTAYHNELVTEQTRLTKKIADNDGGKASSATTWTRAGDMYLDQITADNLREWDRRKRAAGQLIFEQHNLLVSWTKLTVDEFHIGWPPVTIGGMSKHLAANLGHLRKHAAAKEFRLEWRDLAGRIIRCVDLPQYRTQREIGPCPERYPDGDDGYEICCPGIIEVFIPRDRDLPGWLRCQVCRVEWNSTQWVRAGRRIWQRKNQIQRQQELAATFAGKGVAA